MPQDTTERRRPQRPPSIGQILAAEVTAGRVPPQNVEAEVSMLGSILIEKDAIIKIADIVSADDFYVDRHSLIYTAIMDLYEQRQPIDVISLSGKLRDASELEHDAGRAPKLRSAHTGRAPLYG
jgi:replicative DNA helicase